MGAGRPPAGSTCPVTSAQVTELVEAPVTVSDRSVGTCTFVAGGDHPGITVEVSLRRVDDGESFDALLAAADAAVGPVERRAIGPAERGYVASVGIGARVVAVDGDRLVEVAVTEPGALPEDVAADAVALAEAALSP